MTPLIVAGVGGAMVVTGLAILFGIRVDIASFLRLRAEPTPIATISGPGSYHVRGKTATTEHGTLRSPLTGREVLVYRIGIYERRYGTSRGGVERVDNARGEVEFLVDDGSGRNLRVSASDALFALDRTTLYDGLQISPESAPTEIVEWITQQLGAPRTNVRVDERVIEVGEQLSLNGPVRVDDELPKMTSPTTGGLFITTPAGGSRSLVLRQVAIAAALVLMGGVACLVGLVVL